VSIGGEASSLHLQPERLQRKTRIVIGTLIMTERPIDRLRAFQKTIVELDHA